MITYLRWQVYTMVEEWALYSLLSFIHVLREGKKRWSKVVSQAGFLLEGNRVRVSLLALS